MVYQGFEELVDMYEERHADGGMFRREVEMIHTCLTWHVIIVLALGSYALAHNLILIHC